jgi:hypothetical protein
METTIGADKCQGKKTGREGDRKRQGRVLSFLRGAGGVCATLFFWYLLLWLDLGGFAVLLSDHRESIKTHVWDTAIFSAIVTALVAIAWLLLYLSDLATCVRPSATTTLEGRGYLEALERGRQDKWRKKSQKLRGFVWQAVGGLLGLEILGVVLYLGWGLLAGPASKYVVAPYHAYTCKENLQADLAEVLGPTKDPSVAKCSGDHHKATCLVRSLESGIYSTRPMLVDCSRRWTQSGARENASTSAEAREKWDAQLRRFLGAVKSSE